MVFINNKSISVADFSINLIEIIEPFYNLIIDIARQSNEDIRTILERIFDQKILSFPRMESELLKDRYLAEIVSHLMESLYDTIYELEKSDILFLNLRRNWVIFRGDSSVPKKNLQKWLIDFKPLERMFNEIIKDDSIKHYMGKICNLANEQTYSRAIKIENIKVYESVIIEQNWLDESGTSTSIVDNCDLWINKKKLTQFNLSDDHISQFEVNDVYKGDIYIGVEVKPYLIPLISIDKYIKTEFQTHYLWELLTHIFVTRPKGETSPNAETFKTVFKDGEFCKILSHLKFNLYIEKKDKSIPEKYLEYFDEVYSLGLDKLHHIPDLNLFTSVRDDYSDKSLIGVYSRAKVGSSYNLLHWVVGKGSDDAHIYSGGIKGKHTQIIKAFALKPQYSYYYISKFFEDIFVDLLKELDVLFMNNIVLQYEGSTASSIEIDVILKKKDGTIVVIENKTNLSKENIESTLQKFERFHMHLTKGFPDVKIEYLLVAPYSNKSVKDGFYHFIKNSEIGEDTREGYKCKIYDFKIPFPQFENLELRCIVEPEYSKLRSVIQTTL